MYIFLQNRESVVGSTVATLLLSVLVTTGCTSRVTRAQQHLESGKHYLQEQKYSEAAIEFERSLQRNPSDEARYSLALAYIDLRRFPEAYRQLDTIIQSNPAYIPARIAEAELLVQARQTDQARQQVEAVQKLDPQNARAQVLLAKTFMAENNVPQAIQEWDKAKKLAPGLATVWTAAGVARVSVQQYATAEEDFRKALELDPNSVEGYRNLANLLQLTGRATDAEPLILSGIEKTRDKIGLQFLLAEYYFRQNRFSDVENVFAAIKQQGEKEPDLEAKIGDFWMWRDRLDLAIPAYETEQASHPGISIDKRLISSYITVHRVADASRLTQKLLKGTPGDAEGRAFAGALSYLNGNLDAARQELQAVIKDDPGSLFAHYYLGLSWMAGNQLAQAKEEFYDCAKLSTAFPHAYLRLGEIALQEGDANQAIEDGKNVLQQNPRSVEGYLVLGRAYLLKHDFRATSAALDYIDKLGIHSADFYELSAELNAAQNHKAASDDYLERALKTAPQPLGVLARYTSFQVNQGRAQRATESVQSWLAMTTPSPQLYDLLASLFVLQHDWDEAESASRKSLELNPRGSMPHLFLGKASESRGKIREALAEYDECIRQNPREITAYLRGGDLAFAEGQYERAKFYYEAAKQQDPDAPSVNGAIAKWYAGRGENLDVALSIAQELKKALPDDQNVSDTLGWIYYQKRLYSTALQQLEPAASALPSNAVLQYHLGMTYFQIGKNKEARGALTRALKLGLSPSDYANDAEQTLNRIKNS